MQNDAGYSATHTPYSDNSFKQLVHKWSDEAIAVDDSTAVEWLDRIYWHFHNGSRTETGKVAAVANAINSLVVEMPELLDDPSTVYDLLQVVQTVYSLSSRVTENLFTLQKTILSAAKARRQSECLPASTVFETEGDVSERGNLVFSSDTTWKQVADLLKRHPGAQYVYFEGMEHAIPRRLFENLLEMRSQVTLRELFESVHIRTDSTTCSFVSMGLCLAKGTLIGLSKTLRYSGGLPGKTWRIPAYQGTPRTDSATLATAIEFAATQDEGLITEQNAQELLKLALWLDIPELEKICSTHVAQSVRDIDIDHDGAFDKLADILCRFSNCAPIRDVVEEAFGHYLREALRRGTSVPEDLEEKIALMSAAGLSKLDLSGVPIERSLFYLLSKFSSLTYLDLEGCDIGDTDLKHLLNLPLRSLCLAKCRRITDAGLLYISRLPLISLSLRRCYQVTDVGLDYLRGMKLRSLDLKKCDLITDAGLVFLKGMPLNSLNLSDCKVSDKGLEHLSGLPLTSLSLKSCGNVVTDAGLVYLREMQLTSLNLWGCNVGDNGLRHLVGMPLEFLDLGGCGAYGSRSEAGLALLANMPLKELGLHGWNLKDASLVHLARMPLQSLKLCHWRRLTAAGLEHLTQLPLTSLDLYSCTGLTDAALEVVSRLPVTALNLGRCSGFTDEGLAHIARLPLTYLCLSVCEWLTDEGIKHLTPLPLSYLNLNQCKRVTPTGLAYTREMPLNYLNLSWLEELTDESLECLRDMPLNTLKLSGCKKITGMGFVHLVGKALTTLELYGCWRVGDAGLEHLRGMRLTHLNLSSCHQIGSIEPLVGMPLISLDLEGGNFSASTDLGYLKGMPLDFLNLKNVSGMSDAALEQLSGLPLRQVWVNTWFGITDSGLEHLARMPLICLDVEDAWQITNAGLRHFRSPRIHLSLRKCEKLTEEGLIPLRERGISVHLRNDE